jgi:hypothetical protein
VEGLSDEESAIVEVVHDFVDRDVKPVARDLRSRGVRCRCRPRATR